MEFSARCLRRCAHILSHFCPAPFLFLPLPQIPGQVPNPQAASRSALDLPPSLPADQGLLSISPTGGRATSALAGSRAIASSRRSSIMASEVFVTSPTGTSPKEHGALTSGPSGVVLSRASSGSMGGETSPNTSGPLVKSPVGVAPGVLSGGSVAASGNLLRPSGVLGKASGPLRASSPSPKDPKSIIPSRPIPPLIPGIMRKIAPS